MANIEIRNALKKKRMFNYELAELLGVTEWTLSRKLRKELPPEEKQKILDIIEKDGDKKCHYIKVMLKPKARQALKN